jgi:GMP synthase (glutamine-hydrolysing)
MQTPTRRAVVLSHVAFEDLGTLEAPLRAHGFEVESVLAASARFPLRQADSCDLLVVLGGPIGVYETQDYPFLTDEIACIRKRLAAHKPILGICLGAQLMAAAQGARVYPGDLGAEIGWFPLQATPNAATPEWFAPLLEKRLRVFHWHGDTFDLPDGVVPLAVSERYAHQAFTVGDNALALQFHPEVTAADLESWYVGHASELHQKRISVPELRAAARRNGARLEAAAGRFWELWLEAIFPR